MLSRILLVAACALASAPAAEATVTAHVLVDGRDVRIEAAGPGELRVFAPGAQPLEIRVPAGGAVTEIRAAEWRASPGAPGIALAVEVVAADDPRKRSYSWATATLGVRPRSRGSVEKPTGRTEELQPPRSP